MDISVLALNRLIFLRKLFVNYQAVCHNNLKRCVNICGTLPKNIYKPFQSYEKLHCKKRTISVQRLTRSLNKDRHHVKFIKGLIVVIKPIYNTK